MQAKTRNQIIAAGLVAGVALIAWPMLSNGKGAEGGQGGGGRGGPGGPGGRGGPQMASVFAESAALEDFATDIEAVGTLLANERVDLTANAADRVTALYFDDGDRVQRGKVLVQLAQREQEALVEAEEAEAAQARLELSRIEPLAQAGAVSQAELDVARRNAQSAEASLRAVRSRQTDRVISAPFDGVLGLRQVSVGTYVRPGDVVATLIDDRVMKLDFQVSSSSLALLKPGTRLTAEAADLPGLLFEGQIASLDNAIDPVSRAVRVRAELPNPDGTLKSGLFVRVKVKAEARREIGVAEMALQPVGPKTYVWIARPEGGTLVAERRDVTVGARVNGRAEILSGLTPGEKIITEGSLRVREGGVVKIEDPKILTPQGAGYEKPGRPGAGEAGARPARPNGG
jgi:membrane fusion protein (multidrug efflux system)